jgi:hypothetical protein
MSTMKLNFGRIFTMAWYCQHVLVRGVSVSPSTEPTSTPTGSPSTGPTATPTASPSSTGPTVTPAPSTGPTATPTEAPTYAYNDVYYNNDVYDNKGDDKYNNGYNNDHNDAYSNGNDNDAYGGNPYDESNGDSSGYPGENHYPPIDGGYHYDDGGFDNDYDSECDCVCDRGDGYNSNINYGLVAIAIGDKLSLEDATCVSRDLAVYLHSSNTNVFCLPGEICLV